MVGPRILFIFYHEAAISLLQQRSFSLLLFSSFSRLLHLLRKLMKCFSAAEVAQLSPLYLCFWSENIAPAADVVSVFTFRSQKIAVEGTNCLVWTRSPIKHDRSVAVHHNILHQIAAIQQLLLHHITQISKRGENRSSCLSNFLFTYFVYVCTWGNSLEKAWELHRGKLVRSRKQSRCSDDRWFILQDLDLCKNSTVGFRF